MNRSVLQSYDRILRTANFVQFGQIQMPAHRLTDAQCVGLFSQQAIAGIIDKIERPPACATIKNI